MKILVVGDWHSKLHEEVVYQAFKALGHQVEKFPWHSYFATSDKSLYPSFFDSRIRRFQNKYLIGPLFRRVNNELYLACRKLEPDLIFIYRGTHITAHTLQKIKRHLPHTGIVGYNNDDPFAVGHYPGLWRHFMKAVPEYHLLFAYRHRNVEEFKKIGAKEVKLLRSWYIPDKNYPTQLSVAEKKSYGCDVVFVGHYEEDGRKEMLEEIVRSGFRLRLFGPGYEWDPVLEKSTVLHHLLPVRLVWDEEYNKALCGAKIALCFLSKLNRDTYTRRCFEIPATGTMMLSEYSEDLTTLFEAGREADFFRSKEELTEKLNYYLTDDAARRQIAEAGFRRVKRDKHDVVSRMHYVLNCYESITA